MYGLPKVHKDGVPLRPIVSANGAFNENLGKFLANLFNQFSTNDFTCKDSFTQALELNDLIIPNNCIMASIDIVSLFTNVPLTYTRDVILDLIYNEKLISTNIKRADMCKLIDLACTCNFSFNGVIYQQIDGVAMGSALSVIFANIFMCHLERSILPDFDIPYYRRYVDDTFLVLSRETLNILLPCLNNFHINIDFTFEIEVGGSISFLDIAIFRDVNVGHDTKIITSVFRKSTFSGLYSNWCSWTPMKYKLSVIRALHCRARRLCSTDNLFMIELGNIRKFLSKNSYPVSVIKRFEYRCIELRNSVGMGPISASRVDDSRKLYLKLPYFGISSDKFSKTLSKKFRKITSNNIELVTCYKSNKIGAFFNYKDKSDKFDLNNGIYHIKCGSCDSTYIGETKLRLGDRFNKHNNADYFKEFSAVFEHCTANNHNFPDSDNIKLLGREGKWHKRKIKESIYIKNLKPSLNRNVSSYDCKLF